MTAIEQGGKFVTIDGPNGIGKTSSINLVCKGLEVFGYHVLQTKEPTKSFNRANEEKHGYELARLIIEDRRYHLAYEVDPALKQGVYVVCDRYIESSLVYRRLDGIPFEETWQENSSFRVPDVSILLVASVFKLKERLKTKQVLSRFEREYGPEQELAVYKEAHLFLGQHGFKSVVVNNEHTTLDGVAEKIVNLILRLV